MTRSPHRTLVGAIALLIVAIFLAIFLIAKAPDEEGGVAQKRIDSSKPVASPKNQGNRNTSPDVDSGRGANPISLDSLRTVRATSNRPLFELFGKDGYVNEAALRHYNLDSSDAQFIQNGLDKLLESTRQKALNSLTIDSLRTNQEDGVRALKISPFDITKEFEVFASGLSSQFGNDLSKNLLTSFPEDVYFGSFGTRDVGIEVFEKDERDDDFGFHVTVVNRDPVSGDIVSQTTTHSALIDRIFPGLFDIEMRPKN